MWSDWLSAGHNRASLVSFIARLKGVQKEGHLIGKGCSFPTPTKTSFVLGPAVINTHTHTFAHDFCGGAMRGVGEWSGSGSKGLGDVICNMSLCF